MPNTRAPMIVNAAYNARAEETKLDRSAAANID